MVGICTGRNTHPWAEKSCCVVHRLSAGDEEDNTHAKHAKALARLRIAQQLLAQQSKEISEPKLALHAYRCAPPPCRAVEWLALQCSAWRRALLLLLPNSVCSANLWRVASSHTFQARAASHWRHSMQLGLLISILGPELACPNRHSVFSCTSAERRL